DQRWALFSRMWRAEGRACLEGLGAGTGHRFRVAAAGPLPFALDRVAVGAEGAVVDGGGALLAHPDRHRVALEFAHVRECVAVVRVQAAGDRGGRLGAGPGGGAGGLPVGLLLAFAACPSALEHAAPAFPPLPGRLALVLAGDRPCPDQAVAERLQVGRRRRGLNRLGVAAVRHLFSFSLSLLSRVISSMSVDQGWAASRKGVKSALAGLATWARVLMFLRRTAPRNPRFRGCAARRRARRRRPSCRGRAGRRRNRLRLSVARCRRPSSRSPARSARARRARPGRMRHRRSVRRAWTSASPVRRSPVQSLRVRRDRPRSVPSRTAVPRWADRVGRACRPVGPLLPGTGPRPLGPAGAGRDPCRRLRKTGWSVAPTTGLAYHFEYKFEPQVERLSPLTSRKNVSP